jgi:cobalt-zinc-cadmium efflux system protein
VAQTAGAFLFSSVALLADAAHNLSDGLSIGIALVAAWAATLRARGRRTYGWARLEILAALVNGLTLVALGLLIAVEAVRRLDDPPDVQGAGRRDRRRARDRGQRRGRRDPPAQRPRHAAART